MVSTPTFVPALLDLTSPCGWLPPTRPWLVEPRRRTSPSSRDLWGSPWFCGGWPGATQPHATSCRDGPKVVGGSRCWGVIRLPPPLLNQRAKLNFSIFSRNFLHFRLRCFFFRILLNFVFERSILSIFFAKKVQMGIFCHRICFFII